MPPRLVVGSIFGHTPLTHALERAGHTIVSIDAEDDPGAIVHVDLVLLDAGVEGVRWGVDKLEAHARPQQMFVHTALEAGAQLLDDVETAQAIVMCAHNLFGEVWVTSAADELGETILGLLVAELGGMNIPIADTARPALVAAQRLRALEHILRIDAHALITTASPDIAALEDQFFDAPRSPLEDLPPAELNRIADAITDPGVRRLYVDVERRYAEQAQATDAELWAYAKYEGTI
ncbi:hypothetical protein [Corynebacterium sp. HMSC29G08]|uniref:6PGD fold domain-containing protein n=1 Tax=Corynebacterium sp. HMSC29G08 TaxID=1581069 RepID=UPI0008A49E4E|nr:hypothetical protein [Corynebacterium sp. HMSC29G08]